MDPLTIIREKAKAHQERYKSFDLARFMRWVESKPFSWQLAATSQSISALNRQKRYELWDAIQEASKAQYTPEPPED